MLPVVASWPSLALYIFLAMGSAESAPDTAIAEKDVSPAPDHADVSTNADPPAAKVVDASSTTPPCVPPQGEPGGAEDNPDSSDARFAISTTRNVRQNEQADTRVPEAGSDKEADEQRALALRACAAEMASGMLPTSPNKVPIKPPVEPSLSISTPNDKTQSHEFLLADAPSTPSAVTGSDAGLSAKPMTITDLFSGSCQTSGGASQFSLENTHFGYWSPQVESVGTYQTEQLWSTSPWYDYSSSPTLDWSGAYHESSYVYPDYQEWVPPAPAPPLIHGITPAATGHMSGFGKDSPRSVVLTLCGAWGALKTPEANGGISKRDLLSYRRSIPRGYRPKPLKSLRTVQY